ncbi:MAG: branched-chain amino acid ABC transporter ATP-binding protein/permease [Actinobacteria bacterium]|nr:branched-chain amino acid ABC transporter ATP-binding protein/permease [Actinomycetota bacterium]
MSDIVTNAPAPARTRLSARPPAMRGSPYVWLGIFLVFMVALRFVPNWSAAEALVFNDWIYLSIMVVGFYFVFGVAGQFAFSQAAFAMVGGYTSAWATREGLDWILAVALGIAVASVIAFGFAWIARNANLFFLAIATLALSELLLELFKQWKEFTGVEGAEIALDETQRIEIFGWKVTDLAAAPATNERNLFWVFLGGLAIVLVIGTWMARSPAKREAIAMRDQPTVAATSGVPTLRVRISMFVLGSAIGAFAGSLYVHGRGYATPDIFSVELGLGVFVMLIVGGIGSLWGPILGAAFYAWLPYVLRQFDFDIFGHEVREYKEIIYGAVLLIVMIFAPHGLIGLFHAVKAKIQHRAHDRGSRTWLSDFFGITRPPVVEVPVVDETPSGLPRVSAEARARAGVDGASVPESAVMRAAGIHVSFGGVRAVDGVDLDVREGEILGLVGPNGSGKTTFLNAVVGVVPASGYLEVGGMQVPLGTPGRSRGVGVLRTYQAPQTYDHLSCIEDVLVSTSDRKYTGNLASWFARPIVNRHERERWGVAVDALTRVGLGDLAEVPASRLTYGQRRLLELARAIAAGPRVLLLDEPSAGLDAAETDQLASYINDLRDEGVSILLVDHKLDFITGVCDRVAVLEQGRLVAVGDADTVFEDQRVVDAYLGVADVD